MIIEKSSPFLGHRSEQSSQSVAEEPGWLAQSVSSAICRDRGKSDGPRHTQEGRAFEIVKAETRPVSAHPEIAYYTQINQPRGTRRRR
jgi:hypothetical protein